MPWEQLVDAYFDAWSAHDAGGVSKLFATSGTFEDPMTRVALHPLALQAVIDSTGSVFLEFQSKATSKSGRRSRNCGMGSYEEK
jgi:hypothetical protein